MSDRGSFERSNDDGNCLQRPSIDTKLEQPPSPSPRRSRDDGDDGGDDGEGEYYDVANDDSRDGGYGVGGRGADNGDGDDDDDDDDVEKSLSLNELMYSAHSFHAISLPVSITMILAALCVTFINTAETIRQGEDIMASAYHVWTVDSSTQSTSKQLVIDFANGLVIVTVIGTMTFGIVLLYKYRCMKVLIGYMMFSSGMLLGLLGMEVMDVAINKYRIPVDLLTLVFGLYNFAVVGVVSIYYTKCVPSYVTQGYLILTSVILAWQLSHFDSISTWTLLIMLGLYDLCAVLTPCGPLKALVNLMSDEDSPNMPGLLYEAEIPEGMQRPVMSGRARNGGGGGGHDRRGENGDDDDDDHSSQSPPSSMIAERYQSPAPETANGNNGDGRSSGEASGDVELSGSNISHHTDESASSSAGDDDAVSADVAPPSPPLSSRATAAVPFAIARLYRLPIASPPPFVGNTSRETKEDQSRRRLRQSVGSNVCTSPLLLRQGGNGDAAEGEPNASPDVDADAVADDTQTSYDTANGREGEERVLMPADIADVTFNAAQLLTLVRAVLPSNGAKIKRRPQRSTQSGERGEDRYGVIGSDGTLKRILFVNREGKVFEEVNEDDDDEYEGKFSNTIKLGLGDFIFYSVLVATSAQYSFPCFASSFLVILNGLGGTLVLLAVYKHALPALPISIFLAVTFYVLTRFIIEPWIHGVMRTPFYV